MLLFMQRFVTWYFCFFFRKGPLWEKQKYQVTNLELLISRLAIVFTRAAPAFEDLFNTYIWFLLDINTVHTTVKKETFAGIFIEVNIHVTG